MKLRNGGMIALLAALIGASSLALAATPPPKSTNPLAGPTQALADARANQLKAKAELDVIRKRLIPSFETKPDWKAAKDAVDAARAEMDAATKHLVAKLESDPDYKEQLSKRAKAQAIIDGGTTVGVSADDNTAKVSAEDISNAHKDRIDSAYALKKMEKDAQDNDTRYVAAHQKYKEAEENWESLQSQVDDAMKLDPQYPAAQQAVDKADAAVKQAQDQYIAAVKQQSNSHPAPTRR